MKRILVTSTRSVATLDLIRLLAKAGYLVFAAETFSSAIANKSNYLQSFDIISAPKDNEKLYIQDLLSIIKHRRIDLLIPTCEEIFYIAKYRNLLTPHCDVFCSTFDLLTKFHNKWEFSQLVHNDINVASPPTFLITDSSSLQKYISCSEGLVFKPVYSRFADKTLICPAPNSLKKIDFSKGPWIAQTFIKGQEICAYNIAHNGNLSLHGCYKNKYRAGKGAGVYFHAVQNERILTFVRHFVAQYQFHGQISFDFIIDAKGKIFVIECNPRLTSGLHLFREQDETVHYILNHKNHLISATSQKSYMLSLPLIMYGLVAVIKKRVEFKIFLKDLRHATCVTYDPEDRQPFYQQLQCLFTFFYRSIKNKISILEATTYDIEWNG